MRVRDSKEIVVDGQFDVGEALPGEAFIALGGKNALTPVTANHKS